MKTKKIGLDAIPSVGLHLPGANHSSDPMNIIARNFDKVKQVQQPGRVKLLWSFFVDKLQCFLTVQYVSAFS